jgi:hypothetical protein
MNSTCCGILEQLEEEYDGPIERPISFNLKTGDIHSNSWAVHLYNLTPSGAISKKPAPFIFFTYCPFCGEQIRENEK